MQPAPTDLEIAELEAWTDIQNTVVKSVEKAVAEEAAAKRAAKRIAIEAEAMAVKSNLILLAANDFHSIVVHMMSSSSVIRQSNEAVMELLAWKDILDSQPLPSKPTSVQEKEASLYQSVTSPDKDRLDIERKRAEDARNAAEREYQALKEQVNNLHREKVGMEQQLEQLLLERNGCEQSIHSLRVEKLDERSRLEATLKDLRDQVATERRLLDDLKAANNAAAISPPNPYTSPSAADSYSSPAAASGYQRSLSPSGGSPTRGDAPSLSSGLKALQNVREQLREIRESHSPTRANSMSYSASNGSARADDSLQRSYTAGNMGTHAPRAASPYGAASPSGDSASPWKQRLSKLQGDLRLLKAELNTSL